MTHINYTDKTVWNLQNTQCVIDSITTESKQKAVAYFRRNYLLRNCTLHNTKTGETFILRDNN